MWFQGTAPDNSSKRKSLPDVRKRLNSFKYSNQKFCYFIHSHISFSKSHQQFSLESGDFLNSNRHKLSVRHSWPWSSSTELITLFLFDFQKTRERLEGNIVRGREALYTMKVRTLHIQIRSSTDQIITTKINFQKGLSTDEESSKLPQFYFR